MNPVTSITRALYVPAVLFLGACCCNKPVAKQASPSAPASASAPVAAPAVSLGDIFFDFDRSNITANSEVQLKTNAEWMAENQGKSLVCEGHCDERGTAEYNMALGERRAESAKQALMSLGVSGDRLSTISYGEEKPFAIGHDEAAWSQNRRVHFVEK
ncbi:MAG TPA: peptidoglycan-associated lipoprotein Pal [Chlorobaculum parvum]|uniref:Peptidoglycan-associated protein n=1 Tax=Chlorobaculum parvum TaxID=274539 RepID=A0A7C5HF32_9CHLB|nr:peptidoglycan-associated lipoprotein Pal [Chlorobaculum parvum]